MTRAVLFAACLLASGVAAFAGPSRPSDTAGPDCSGLAAARTQARAAAAPHAYQVIDLDGENARSFEQGQHIPERFRVDHLTVMVNPKTGRAAALLNDGPGCAFDTVSVVFEAAPTAIDSALAHLSLGR